MICDSTNVFNPGRSGSEQDVRESLLNIISKKINRVLITSFASNVARMETIFYCAKNRKTNIISRQVNEQNLQSCKRMWIFAKFN